MSEKMVSENSVVTLDYTVTMDDGKVVDSSKGGDPLQYLHGHHMLIPGLEKALDGMKVGESRQVTVPPEEGYGQLVEDATEWVDRELFPAEVELLPGTVLHIQEGEDEIYPARIVEVESDRVLLDYNHPLAGKTLHFDVTIVDVRPATATELEHGHVHDEDEF
jgi:FKBP-type peptidyl-prolyl cis-trans isomerase SlyD